MANKRLVMAPSPGTGLFVHEAKAKDRGRYGKELPVREQSPGSSLAQQEEERVNGRLVDILERKVSKLRQRADSEEQRRQEADRERAEMTQELMDLRQLLRDRDRQVADLCAAQRDLAEDRKAAPQRAAALEAAENGRTQALRELASCQAELHRQRQQSAKLEAEWKGQIQKLVTEMKASARELHDSKEELSALRMSGQQVVSRYEAESQRRLELEARCLALEEKVARKEQRARGDVDAATTKAKQNAQACTRAEEVSEQLDGRLREALLRASEAEMRCRGLEQELQRLRQLCADRGQRLEQLEVGVSAAVIAFPTSTTGGHASVCFPKAKTFSRPGTGNSSTSSRSAPCTLPPRGPQSQTTRTVQAGPADHGKPRTPGAIRRAGSVPTRRGPTQGTVTLTRAASLSAADEDNDLDFAQGIPSEPDSSEDEVLSPVKAAK